MDALLSTYASDEEGEEEEEVLERQRAGGIKSPLSEKAQIGRPAASQASSEPSGGVVVLTANPPAPIARTVAAVAAGGSFSRPSAAAAAAAAGSGCSAAAPGAVSPSGVAEIARRKLQLPPPRAPAEEVSGSAAKLSLAENRQPGADSGEGVRRLAARGLKLPPPRLAGKDGEEAHVVASSQDSEEAEPDVPGQIAECRGGRGTDYCAGRQDLGGGEGGGDGGGTGFGVGGGGGGRLKLPPPNSVGSNPGGIELESEVPGSEHIFGGPPAESARPTLLSKLPLPRFGGRVDGAAGGLARSDGEPREDLGAERRSAGSGGGTATAVHSGQRLAFRTAPPPPLFGGASSSGNFLAALPPPKSKARGGFLPTASIASVVGPAAGSGKLPAGPAGRGGRPGIAGGGGRGAEGKRLVSFQVPVNVAALMTGEDSEDSEEEEDLGRPGTKKKKRRKGGGPGEDDDAGIGSGSGGKTGLAAFLPPPKNVPSKPAGGSSKGAAAAAAPLGSGFGGMGWGDSGGGGGTRIALDDDDVDAEEDDEEEDRFAVTRGFDAEGGGSSTSSRRMHAQGGASVGALRQQAGEGEQIRVATSNEQFRVADPYGMSTQIAEDGFRVADPHGVLTRKAQAGVLRGGPGNAAADLACAGAAAGATSAAGSEMHSGPWAATHQHGSADSAGAYTVSADCGGSAYHQAGVSAAGGGGRGGGHQERGHGEAHTWAADGIGGEGGGGEGGGIRDKRREREAAEAAAAAVVEVRQADLTKGRVREDQLRTTGIAFGPAYRPSAAVPKDKASRLGRRKHQIGSLYQEMQQKQMELVERRAKGMLTKAQTQGKYGWS